MRSRNDVKIHARYCSSGVLLLDYIWHWFSAWTNARVLAGAAAGRDRSEMCRRTLLGDMPNARLLRTALRSMALTFRWRRRSVSEALVSPAALIRTCPR